MKYLLTIVLALTLTACGSSSESTPAPIEPTPITHCSANTEYTTTIDAGGSEHYFLTQNTCNNIQSISSNNNIILNTAEPPSERMSNNDYNTTYAAIYSEEMDTLTSNYASYTQTYYFPNDGSNTGYYYANDVIENGINYFDYTTEPTYINYFNLLKQLRVNAVEAMREQVQLYK